MAAKIHGRLGAQDLAATTMTAVYAAPASRKATCSVSICNRNGSAVAVRLAYIDGAVGALANEDYLEFGTQIAANGVLERTGIPVSAGHTLAAYASNTGVSVVIVGIEEDA